VRLTNPSRAVASGTAMATTACACDAIPHTDLWHIMTQPGAHTSQCLSLTHFVFGVSEKRNL